jgi:hypothetical protein
MNLREVDCEMANRITLVRGPTTGSQILVSCAVTH